MIATAREPVIHLHCLCWNDSVIIPHFLRHYDSFVNRFFIYDNNSTDGSAALCRAHPRATVTTFDVPGPSFVEEEKRLSDTVWMQSRGEADWVIIVDMDEFLYHPNIVAYLQMCAGRDISVIQALGFDMMADALPGLNLPLHHVVTKGVRSLGYDKICIFDPNALTQTNFTLGRHGAVPGGRVHRPYRPFIALLHYKHLGLEYAQRRSQQLRLGLRPGDLEKGYGSHYLRSDAEIAASFQALMAQAEPVPGLYGGPPFDLLGIEEYVIRVSGLFDDTGYLARNPDVAAARIDPVAHFHNLGWREGRIPNTRPDWLDFKRSIEGAGTARSNPYLGYFVH